MLLVLVAATGARAADNTDSPRITIGGVVYTDVRDPVRTGLSGVTVQVRGDQGVYEAVTGSVIGLWKMDVPLGTYTVTPGKSGYVMEHLVGGWCDGQRAITIEVNPKNRAANQSIQFLAIYWPEPNTPTVAETPAEAPPASTAAPRAERTGGGCAAVPGHRGDIGGFFAPYAACVCALWAASHVEAHQRRRRRE
jgi:hypothetical protein